MCERVLPGRDEDDEASDQEREDRRQQRHDDPAGLLRNRQPGGEALRVAALWRLFPEVRRRPERRRIGSAHATAFLPRAGHRDAQLVLGDARSELAHDLALVDHEDPVGEREDLLQLERDEQYRTPLVALLDEAAMDELDRTDVEAARRLGRDQHLRVAIDLAREHDLLLIAAREATGERLRAAAADVELLQQPPRPLHQALRKEPAEARGGLMVVVVEGDVLRQREVEHEPAPLPVLRNVAEPRVEAVAAAVVGDVLVPDDDSPRFHLPEAGDGVDQLGLAVAVDAGEAHDLAPAHLERDAADLLEARGRPRPSVLQF